VSPENVAQRVMLLRQSLSDDANRPRYIETVRNKGYRLIPVVERVSAAESDTKSRRRWLVPSAAAVLLALGITAAANYWAIGWGDAGAPPPLSGSVAVLPFENLSPPSDDAMLAAAMQDEIVSQLTKIRGLRVFPVGEGRPTQRSPVDVARDLNVATTLTGSVYYSSGRVRVIPRLTNAMTGASLWSQPYERELDDIFAIRSEIALEVAKALSIELSAMERERVERVPTKDPQARELYLRAKAREGRYTRRDELLRAMNEIEQALAIDSEFKEAWLLAMSIHTYAVLVDWERSETHRLRAEQAARRALELDAELGEPYVAIGALASLDKRWIAAEKAFSSARDRNVPWADLGPYALLRLTSGDFFFGRDIWEQGRAATPQSATAQRFLAFHYEGLGERAAAKALYESAGHLFPDDQREVSRMRLQRMHWLVGRNELAQARSIPVDDPLNTAMLENRDSRQQALEQLNVARVEADAGDFARLIDIGLWFGHFGEPKLALDAMRAAIDAQGQMMVYLWLPQLAPMRRLPEFEDYMREVGMVAYWEEYDIWPPFCHKIDEHEFECD